MCVCVCVVFRLGVTAVGDWFPRHFPLPRLKRRAVPQAQPHALGGGVGLPMAAV